MISFVIITDNQEPEKLARAIDSIRALNIPGAELFVVEDTHRTGRLGALRNKGCRMTNNPVLVVSDDDIYFAPDWYEGLQAFGDDYDILSCKILNPDGSRYWDWKINVNGLNELLDYDKTSPNVSLTGGLTIMKRQVFEKVQWDETKGFYQAEDVDWTNRAKAAGFRIDFNPHCTVTHDGPYTQAQKWVVRTE